MTEDSRDAILKTYTASGISFVMTGIACPIQSYLFRSEFHAYITKYAEQESDLKDKDKERGLLPERSLHA